MEKLIVSNLEKLVKHNVPSINSKDTDEAPPILIPKLLDAILEGRNTCPSMKEEEVDKDMYQVVEKQCKTRMKEVEENEPRREEMNGAYMSELSIEAYSLYRTPLKYTHVFFKYGLNGFIERGVGNNNRKTRIGLLSVLYESVYVELDVSRSREPQMTIWCGIPGSKTVRKSSLVFNRPLHAQDPAKICLPQYFHSASFYTYQCLSTREKNAITTYWQFYSREAFILFKYLHDLVRNYIDTEIKTMKRVLAPVEDSSNKRTKMV